MSADGSPESSQVSLSEYSEEEVLSLHNLKILEPNDQIKELQTIIRDQ